MENASKALVMAGGILVGLLIIGALLLMFNNLSSYQQSDLQNTRETQIIEFNNQFTTYDRQDVRGNELYSLINRVVDYNLRKTIEGEGEALEIAYQPMKVTFTLKSKDGKNKKAFSVDTDIQYLLTSNDYTIDNARNTFEDAILPVITRLERDYSSKVLNSLITGMSKIFVDSTATDDQKRDAIIAYNNIVLSDKKITEDDFNKIATGSQIRKDVYTYYEYIQFKRAKFNCINSKYDNKTGRILELGFEFTGKFQ